MSTCIDCGLCDGHHEITCAFYDELPPPSPPSAKIMHHAVVDGLRRVSVCFVETTPADVVRAKLSAELERRLYQDTYAPVESVPLFTIESEAPRPAGRRRA